MPLLKPIPWLNCPRARLQLFYLSLCWFAKVEGLVRSPLSLRVKITHPARRHAHLSGDHGPLMGHSRLSSPTGWGVKGLRRSGIGSREIWRCRCQVALLSRSSPTHLYCVMFLVREQEYHTADNSRTRVSPDCRWGMGRYDIGCFSRFLFLLDAVCFSTLPVLYGGTDLRMMAALRIF